MSHPVQSEGKVKCFNFSCTDRENVKADSNYNIENTR